MTTATSPRTRISNLTLLIVASISIFVYGMIASVAGTIVPQLSRRLDLTPEQIGNLFLLQALGMIVASVGAGPLVDNKGKKMGMIVALSLIMLALFALPQVSSYAAILVAMSMLGLGGGTLTTAASSLLSDVNPERRAAILSLTKCSYGVGGFATPLIGATLLAGNTIALAYLIAGITAATWITMAVIAVPPPSGERKFKLAEAGPLLRNPLLWLLSFTLFLYVACEVGTFNWLPKYLIAQGIPDATALRVLSFGYALGLLLGRLAFAAVLMKVRATTVTVGAALGMIFTTGGILMTGSSAAAGVLAFLAGLAMAPVFPSVVAIVGDNFPRMTGTAMGIVITSGWIGLAASSRLIGGIAGNDPARMGTGLLVLPVFSVVMLAVAVVIWMKLRSSAAQKSRKRS